MTIHDIELICRDWLTPEEVAAVEGGSGNGIRTIARTRGLSALGYPATWVSEHSLKIPRVGYLNWYYRTHYVETDWEEVRKAAATVTKAIALLNEVLLALDAGEVKSCGQDRQSDG